MMRDIRINLIFEGSSEVMHLFMAREAVDPHLQVAGTMIDPHARAGAKLAAVPGILAHYARWYPPLWLRGLGTPFRYRGWRSLGRHLRFIERACRKLARESFHGMLLYQAKMQRKQAFLFRCVDVVMELFAMTAACARAERMRQDCHPEAASAVELADVFCRQSRRKVRRLFGELWRNDDARLNRTAADVLRGRHAWLSEGRLDLGLGPEAFRTHFLTTDRRAEEEPEDRELVAS
jgi:hypothetical protein